jgi:putative ABC transport system permease protein
MSSGEYSATVIRPYTIAEKASQLKYLTINIQVGNPQELITEIENLWNEQETGFPFQYYFYDELFNQNFESENRLSRLLGIFSGMAIFIGLLGLVGLVSYSTEQLKKSIGIRKVFGASITSILLLLTRDFIKLLLIAFAIAIPISNYFMEDWLNEFIYQVNIEVWFFATPGLIILIIALLTIWSQSLSAAGANPVDAIKNE